MKASGIVADSEPLCRGIPVLDSQGNCSLDEGYDLLTQIFLEELAEVIQEVLCLIGSFVPVYEGLSDSSCDDKLILVICPP